MLTCGTWVRRGIAKEIPDKISLAEEDLKQLVETTKDKIRSIKGNENINLDEDELGNEDENDISAEEDEGEEDNSKPRDTTEYDSDDAIREEYGLDNYDDEEGSEMTGAGMAGLTYYTSTDDDPYINIKDLDEEERSDDLIKENDNLFVIGKMEEEYSSLDVYVYDEEENNLFVHHDILLESFPLCLEWLSYDPGADGKPGNYVAVGTMEPDIQIWDLDIIDTIEPAFVLAGRKKKKKKKKKKSSTEVTTNKNGHTDAVLSLSWNKMITKILASASADMTVLLWDMSQGTCVHSLEHHTDKVQSVSFHPVEAQSLLTGSFDKTAVVLDCRTPDVYKSWSLPGECEQVLWDHFSPYNFFVSTDDGIVSYFDVRTDTPVFKVNAHDKEVTGISLSREVPGCFTTVSADEALKVWSYKENKPLCVLSRDMKMGGLNFITSCPDIGLTYAMGGQKDGLRILNLLETNQGKEHFQSAPSQKTVDKNSTTKTNKNENTSGETQMETDHAAEALATLTLKKDNETENVIVKRKKKKKKK